MECPICLTQSQTPLIPLHDSLHLVCETCKDNLRAHFILACPICRHPINNDLVNNLPPQRKVISDIQLRAFNISQEFIDNLHTDLRIPFFYTSRFEGVDFIRTIQTEYEQWDANYSLESS
jgi:hypothetical protein